jgi:hypothetical protein
MDFGKSTLFDFILMSQMIIFVANPNNYRTLQFHLELLP